MFAELINKFNHSRYDPESVPATVNGLLEQFNQFPNSLKELEYLFNDEDESYIFIQSANTMMKAFEDLLESVKPNEAKQFHETKNELRKVNLTRVLL